MVGLVVSVNNKLESSNFIGKSTECTLVQHARKIIDYHPFLAFTLEGNLRKIEFKNNCGDSPFSISLNPFVILWPQAKSYGYYASTYC